MNDPKTRDSDTPRLLLLADHPSLHRGFATVAREVAGHLHDQGRWQVSMIGYYPPDPDWRSPGYPVLSLDPNDVPRSERRACQRSTRFAKRSGWIGSCAPTGVDM